MIFLLATSADSWSALHMIGREGCTQREGEGSIEEADGEKEEGSGGVEARRERRGIYKITHRRS